MPVGIIGQGRAVALDWGIFSQHFWGAYTQQLQHCPTCRSAEVVRRPRAWLTCKSCPVVIHSDQAGSRNIAQVQDPNARWDGPKAGPRTATQRWTHHRWILRSANPRRQAGLPEFLLAAE